MSSDATPGPAPRSTYRLQLGPELTFAAAAGLADYLAGLGVTHAYLSPILRAAPGSTHGYDVVDHGHLNEELGGLRGFRKLAAALRAKNIGIVVDVVPNHMAVPVPEALNAALWSVLRHGRESPYDAWFDIDWDAGGGRLLMPLLDGPVESNLDRLFVERRRGRPPQLRYFDHVLPLADGTAQLPMRELVDAQHYRLADWRTASTELNYRRFCDITSLIGVRVEDPAVFATTHAVLVDLVADGDVQGLRIDHPDGLADPARYFADLAEVTDDAWVVVEKILADGEPLPADWRVAGTTGYETLTVLNGLLVDPAGEGPLSRTYTELTGDTADFATVAGEGKQLAARDLLAAEVSRLVRLLPASQSASDIESVETLRDAVVEVLTGLDVYRPYAASPMTLVAVEDAARHAGQRRPDLRLQIEEVRALALQPGEFATRFAQTAAAVFAKGVEDTAFYRHARLLALNEVGGDPGRFGVRLAEFHHFALELQASSPTAMTTLSTHDTK
ncbi:MAG: (1-_4)-alpha-D-glucan 1-alpha-D-glucosylmutase, partial [Actinomycetota bacterium]|nr:(1->4)-alpha-D-glucan 1-alpha-D-glucosylmutase [Actinomycetota bacterium]